MKETEKINLSVSILIGIFFFAASPQEDILKRLLGTGIFILVMYMLNNKLDEALKVNKK